MKLLLISVSDKSYETLSAHVKPLGFELIRYKHVLKAMDNIDEIDPAGIIINASDFPRHWKIFVQFVRSERSKENTPIILLRGSAFPLEDMDKVFYLEVNGIVSETLGEAMEADRLRNILNNNLSIKEKRKERRYNADKNCKIECMFSHPDTGCIVTGIVKNISKTGISFKPHQKDLLNDLPLLREIPTCSLKIGGEIISPACKLVHSGKSVSLEFAAFEGLDKETLNEYLDNIPLSR